MKRLILFLASLLFAVSCVFGQDCFEIASYYPIADQNEWRYTAPEGWPEGDYISKIVAVKNEFTPLFSGFNIANSDRLFQLSKDDKTFRHFDATKASKLLSVGDKGIRYHGESFSSDGSIAVFEKPIHWFNVKEKVGAKLEVERNYTRFYKDGTQSSGSFKMTQEITKKENISVPAGDFKDCLRIEFDTYWDLGDGLEAKSINIYHHAKGVGVVKASARFIIIKEGVEIINRLVVPDLKSFNLY